MAKIVRKTTGFTLIELLVVIAIIGVLTAVLLPNMVGIRGRAADSRVKSDLAQLKTALRLYYNDFQSYPQTGSTPPHSMMGCGAGGIEVCAAEGAFSNVTTATIYMPELPEEFYYQQTNSGDGFVVCAALDNDGDADIAESQSDCSPPTSMVDTTGALLTTSEAYCTCGL